MIGGWRFPMIAGGGSVPPDYCVNNGYVLLEEPWTPPFTPIAINNEEIILFCDDTGYGIVRLTCTTSSGPLKLECIDTDGNILSTYTGALSGYVFTFPTKDTDTYYQLRISPNTVGASIRTLAFNIPTGYADTDFSIYKILFKTPNLITADAITSSNSHIKEVEFIGACDSLTSLNNSFRGVSLTKLTLPTSMLALIQMSGTFNGSNLKIIDLSGYVLDYLQNASSSFTGCKADIIKLPLSTPVLSICQNILQNTIPKLLQLPAIANFAQFTSGMSGCTYTGEVVIPDSPNIGVSEFSNAFGGSYFKKITFPTTDNKTVNYIGFASSYIQEIVFPTNTSSVVTMTMASQKRLKYITVPDSAPSLMSITIDSPFFIKIKNAPDYSAIVISLDLYSWSLEELNWPTLRIKFLRVGQSTSLRATLLTSINIDWANSEFSGTATVLYLQASLDATELNRIFTLLPPPLSGTPRIDVRFTTGGTTCDKTIATAKGYTFT